MTAVKKIQPNANAVALEFLEAAATVILGKPRELKLMLTCILADGHLLIEDVPGVGKTTFVKTLQALTSLDFKRIQFTNDLLPSDIVGGQILNTNTNEFYFRKGPIFCELLLADEINRATPKTQSACLQAMEEGEVSIDGNTYPLPQTFFVIATQNPNSSIGTFPLPESQLDRFLMRLRIGFPSREAERELLKGVNRKDLLKKIEAVLPAERIRELQGMVQQVHTSDHIIDYVQDILAVSRIDGNGLSPRTALDLIAACKAYAFLGGQDFVKPQDVLDVAPSVINHRLNSHDELDGWKAADKLLARVRPK
jgi:MoxR-like ATPase